MKLALFAFSRRGCQTARRVLPLYPGVEIAAYAPQRLEQPDFAPITKDCYAQRFADCDMLIFVGSCGIAVRKIAPYVQDKTTDPAVLCMDELGTFVIPILSGHIGGANRAARRLSDHLGATPVITTATDINGRFSPDAWAAEQGLAISSMALCKRVNAAILEGDIPICSDFPLPPTPAGITPGECGPLGIALTWKTDGPFDATLRLIPKCLHLGLGCRKGTDKASIRALVSRVLAENGIDPRAIRSAASIDLKAREAGLLEFCREENLPIHFYSAGELRSVPGSFTPSAFVASVTGVDNVCERSAMMGADRLIVQKCAENGVTVAIAAERYEVCFG